MINGHDMGRRRHEHLREVGELKLKYEVSWLRETQEDLRAFLSPRGGVWNYVISIDVK